MGEHGSHRGSWSDPSSIHPLFRSHLTPTADLAVAIFLTFTGVTSVLGNGTVLLVYCRKRKKLRPPELMTINLAFCDFGFSLLGAPFFIISSLCHAWVFGETGCLWYSIQGFVFGIGSLLTTCLISVDRCLKICCLRYGQWIERQHVSLSIALLWVYTVFWAMLPAFGFGSYGPEPYGTSCTINWWKMRSSMSDRIYIFLVLMLCFGLPTLTIICSYLAILLTVYRSSRTLASIPSSSVSHSSKDLRLAKIAAVVCATFLMAWLPYATVSLMSALIPRGDQEDDSTIMTAGSPHTPQMSLFNWTAADYNKQSYYNPHSKWSEVNITSSASISSLSDVMLRSSPSKDPEPKTQSPEPLSSFPPLVTLIPAMFAKSHCMINPLIYQIMNREFREDVYEMVFGPEMAERRGKRGRNGSLYEKSITLPDSQSWRRKRSHSMCLSVNRKERDLMKQKNQSRSRTDSSAGHSSAGADDLDLDTLSTQGRMETQSCCSGHGDMTTLNSEIDTMAVE
ncbi:uncharacterized protein V6R79_022973 [Siganus canaliculatus]